MTVVVRKKKRLEEYNFSNETKNRVEPIVMLLQSGKLLGVKQEIAGLALEICEGIENGTIAPRQADEYFTLLDLYLDDNYLDLELGETVGDLLFEGMSLHDLGESYGPDLEMVRGLAYKMASELSPRP